MSYRRFRVLIVVLLAVASTGSGIFSPGQPPLALKPGAAAAADSILTTCNWTALSDAVQALQAAGGGNLVLDCAGTTIPFDSAVGTINITSDVTISAPNATFDGGAPFFDVGFSGRLTLVGMTLQNADIDTQNADIRGGAVRSSGSITVIGTRFLNNSVTSDGAFAFGAAIYASGSATVIGSTFIGNTAAGDHAAGGAIRSLGRLTVVGSHFEANQVNGDESGSRTGSQAGAISMDGSSIRTIRHSTFVDNKVTDPDYAEGGALFSFRDVPLTIEDSTFERNEAGTAGAIYHYGTLDIDRSTFLDNRATSSTGGAIAIWGFQSGIEELTVRASTFHGNHANFRGGAIYGAQYSSTTIEGSTFYENTADDSGSALARVNLFSSIAVGSSIIDAGDAATTINCNVNITSLNYNISSDSSCGLGSSNDQQDTDPLLAALADNGGPTLTHAPATGSPAIDQIPAADCEAYTTTLDQRGVARPVSGACDVGAVESSGTGVVPVSLNVLYNDSPTLVNVPATIYVQASGPAGASLNYSFDCDGDGGYGGPDDVGPQSEPFATCNFATAGDHEVNVRVESGLQAETGTTTITVIAPSPNVATPTFSLPTVGEGDDFTAQATFSVPGAPQTVTCTVDYGEGVGEQTGTVNGSTCIGPAYSYSDGGAYTVTVEVCADGACDSNSASLNVINYVPDAGPLALVPIELNEGGQVQVTLTFSDRGVADTHTCSIDWGDGAVTAGTVNTALGTCSATHVYVDDGTVGTSSDDYTITATVEDDDGGVSDPLSDEVTVNNVAPEITALSHAGSVPQGTPITFTVTATDPGGVHDPLTYEFDCTNDGTYDFGPIPSNTADCVYPAPGSYTVKVRVSDDDLGFATETSTVQVTNVAPAIGSIDVTPEINEGESVDLSVSFTDSSADTHTCVVDWGDGSTESGVVDQTADTCVASHTYLDNATPDTPLDDYTVSVTISDGVDSATDSATVTVNNLAPVINEITSNAPVPQGQPVEISVDASDPAGALDPLLYEFDCANDGVFEIGPQADNTASCSLNPGAASTTIAVRVSDDDGGQVDGSLVVTQSMTVCVSRYTGHLYGTRAGGCDTSQYALSLPGPAPLTLCFSRATNGLAYFGPRGCTGLWAPLVVPDLGPIEYCQSVWTGQLRYLQPGRACVAYERHGVIPGS